MAKAGKNVIWVVVGRPGTGKSTFIEGDKSVGEPGLIYLDKQPKKIIYDFNNEYNHYPRISYWQLQRLKKTKRPKTMFDPDFNNFLEKVNDIPLCNALLLCEDSTAYIGSDLPKEIKENLAVMRHRNVNMIFTYHTIGMVRPKLLGMATHITIFKTQETGTGKKKMEDFPGMLQTHEKVKRDPNPHARQTIQLQ